MIARITIIMALLSIANCVGKRTIEFRVEKKYGFLHIFKYIGYSLYVKEGETAETSDPKKCTSDWYFWSGYQEKFKDGTYKISLITQVNAEEEKAPIEVQLEAKGDLILLAKNVPIDSRCTVSKEFDYRIEDKGWNKNFAPGLLDFVEFLPDNPAGVPAGIYSASWEVNTYGTLYNPAHLEKAGLDPKKAPATTVELLEMAKKIKADRLIVFSDMQC